MNPFVYSTTKTQRSGEGPFLGPSVHPAWLAHALLEGEVRARASEVAGEGEGAEGSPAW